MQMLEKKQQEKFCSFNIKNKLGFLERNPTNFNYLCILGTFPLESPDQYATEVFESAIKIVSKKSKNLVMTSPRFFPLGEVIAGNASVSDIYDLLQKFDDAFDIYLFGDEGKSILCITATDRVAVVGFDASTAAEFARKIDSNKYQRMLTANLEGPSLSEPVWNLRSGMRMNWY